ncbi:MAG: NAD(P)/FAD-dependent oxidoreductase [Chloroflexi bacterium]|nr:NAD(P)/FAD-dependent oxidoreductase [Chloroflexota bacterium]
MPGKTRLYDAIVVGSGPNGLAAAITIARTGRSILVIEARDTIGGGTRTAELNLPGFRHDICSAVHPLGLGSPFFQSLPLAQFGLEWIFPPAALAHPLDDGTAAVLYRSVEETARTLGPDGAAYTRLLGPLAADWSKLAPALLGPLSIPRHPLALARFSMHAWRSAQGLARSRFKHATARAFFGGMSAHSILPLEKSPSAAFGLVLASLGHAVGWPIPRGGSQQIAEALAAYLRSLGGEIITGQTVESVDDLPPARTVLLDITPRQVLKVARHHLSTGYQRGLERFRYGPGIFKIDYALSGPVPWAAPGCAEAGTLHLCGTLEEVVEAERAATQGRLTEKPFVLVTQPSRFDPTRAPAGQHTLWAYCHVPNGSTHDMSEAITAQIERFAPGFRQLILARSTMNTAEVERYNPNYIGGDINGGTQDWFQLFTRPMPRISPYSTSNPKLFICSSSTPPGGGVHGMCGFFAAKEALKKLK